METAPISLPTLDAVRRHVLQALCARDHLDVEQPPLHEAVITRAGRACGLLFRVQRPRLQESYAVWAAPERRILFYDPAGGPLRRDAAKERAGFEGAGGGTCRSTDAVRARGWGQARHPALGLMPIPAPNSRDNAAYFRKRKKGRWLLPARNDIVTGSAGVCLPRR
jgi:hypothetical protein